MSINEAGGLKMHKFKMVPVEPTEAMNKAGMRWLTGIQHMRAGDKRNALSEAFSAMVDTAPGPPAFDEAAERAAFEAYADEHLPDAQTRFLAVCCKCMACMCSQKVGGIAMNNDDLIKKIDIVLGRPNGIGGITREILEYSATAIDALAQQLALSKEEVSRLTWTKQSDESAYSAVVKQNSELAQQLAASQAREADLNNDLKVIDDEYSCACRDLAESEATITRLEATITKALDLDYQRRQEIAEAVGLLRVINRKYQSQADYAGLDPDQDLIKKVESLLDIKI